MGHVPSSWELSWCSSLHFSHLKDLTLLHFDKVTWRHLFQFLFPTIKAYFPVVRSCEWIGSRRGNQAGTSWRMLVIEWSCISGFAACHSSDLSDTDWSLSSDPTLPCSTVGKQRARSRMHLDLLAQWLLQWLPSHYGSCWRSPLWCRGLLK